MFTIYKRYSSNCRWQSYHFELLYSLKIEIHYINSVNENSLQSIYSYICSMVIHKNVSVTIQSPWPITIQMHSLWYNWEWERGSKWAWPSRVAARQRLTGIRTDSVNYHNGVLSLKNETSMYGDGRWEHIYSRKYIYRKWVHYNVFESELLLFR